jgi:hypothetical protein
MNSKTVLSKIMALLSKDEVELTYAKLADGTIVESPTFDVGEPLDIVSEDGTKTPAPDGEHELALKDESGNENLIKVITKDGKIVERENVELADAETIKEQPIPSVGNEDKENVMPDLKGQVKDGTMMAEVTEEATEDMPETDGKPLGENEEESEEPSIEIELGDMKKKMEEMAYRIEEMEKKMMEMEKVKEEVVDKKAEEEVEMAEEEELPKLDGAPIEEATKFAAESNKKNYGKTVKNYQSTFLSKLYN